MIKTGLSNDCPGFFIEETLKKYGFAKFYRLKMVPFECTFVTARPDGSALFLNDSSQARASAVLQAIDGTEGTQVAAWSLGKCSLNI